MKKVHITDHARKRIESDHRTQLTVKEVVDLLHEPYVLKDGRIYIVYSKVDDTTLELVTARQGHTLITLYDTSRRGTRLPDMVARARAGAHFEFSQPRQVTGFNQGEAVTLSLGVAKERKDKLQIEVFLEVCSAFGMSMKVEGSLETKFLHECVVTATDELLAKNELSKGQIKRLHFFIDDETHSHMTYVPVWISYLLLGKNYPGYSG